MIRMIQSNSEAHAKAYFEDALTKSDYYIDDQELSGRLQGRLQKRLGLGVDVTKDVFFALCENRNPISGDTLTPRTKAGRRVGYDINFHAPKSVSILHALSKDAHIADAFRESVSAVMQAIEADCRTRVRKDGATHTRGTDELIWAEFMHQTARPVEGQAPDPHLHQHCFVFNMTFDKVENRIKAGDFANIKKDMPYYQALFFKDFSDRLIGLGYGIRKTAKSFEIDGVPQPVLDLFSKRTDEIGRYAKEKGITNPDKLGQLGARTRAKKEKGLSMTDLKAIWRGQIKELKTVTGEEKHKDVRHSKQAHNLKISAEKCVDYSLQHCFQRVSVIPERRLLESALMHGIGDRETSSDAITKAINTDSRIIKVEEKDGWKCTTKEVLTEEKKMIELARQGQGQIRPLYMQAPQVNLKGQQLNAVQHVLTTTNRVSIIRGAAGAGKTNLMQEARKWIEPKKKLTVVAPTGSASRDTLVKEGFENANTVAALLISREMQDCLKNGVLWVDEAGLLGTKDMTSLLELANKQNAQLILGGDTRQHPSVIRGDALRILNTVGKLKTAEVSKIYRQKNEPYKAAVEDLAMGKVETAFTKLDAMGAVKEIDPLKPNEQLVSDYMELVKKGKSVLIVSPTHKQGETVTAEVRAALQKQGKLGKRETAIRKLTSLGLSDAEKSDWRNLKQGQYVQFSQNVRKIKRGSLWLIDQVNKDGVYIKDAENKRTKLPTELAERFDVFDGSILNIAKGDQLMVTRRGFDADRKRMESGQTFHVIGMAEDKIVLQNQISKATYKVDKDFGHLAHAYCITSYASQGKTVDHVLISQPASTFTATNAKQFYVSVSRGRYSVIIYTDDKEALLKQAMLLGDRQSALELAAKNNIHLDYVLDKKRKSYSDPAKLKEQQKNNSKTIFERTNEPRL